MSRPEHPSAAPTRVLRFVVSLLTLATASAASAQFTTLDQQKVTTHLGASFGVVVVDEPASDLDSVGRLDIRGELAFGNWSVYTALPFMFTLGGSPKQESIGNLEVGGAHRWDADGPLSVVSHVGLVFPTADSGANETNLRRAGSTGQIGDYYVRSEPDLWALRIATSPRLDAGIFVAQGDLGFDFLCPEHSEDNVGLRSSVGVGVKVLIVTATAEVANAGLLTKDDSFNQTLSFGLKLSTFILSPHVTYTTNLNDRLGDNYEIAVGASVGF